MADPSEHFNPAEKFTTLQGQLYLEVKWRIVWLRDDAPESQIRCEHVVLTDQLAVFKATVTRIIAGEIKGVGEGYGSEQPKDFKDYIEKAETKAIGRALAALGYGTAAAFGEDPTRIADAPVKAPAAERRPPATRLSREEREANLEALAPSPRMPEEARAAPAQVGQVRAIRALWERLERPPEKLGPFLFEQFAQNDPAALTQEEAGKTIGELDKEVRLERAAVMTR